MKRVKGTLTPEGNRKIAITFDPDLFKKLAEEAARSGISFSMLVRWYIKKGMEK